MTTQATTTEQLQEEVASLKATVEQQDELLRWFRRQVFGEKSERIVSNLSEKQMEFEGFSQEQAQGGRGRQVKSHERRKSKRNGQNAITLPPDLPVERIEIDLSEEEKICPITGKSLEKIGEETTLKLACKPGSYYLKEIVRPKYAFPKTSSEEGIRTADLPEMLLQRCQADESFLADLLTKKYCDHLPLYRIEEILSREGIRVSRQTLCNWVRRAGEALEPLYLEMRRKIFESGNVFVDEVPVPQQVKGKGKLKKSYMWVVSGGLSSNPGYRIYHFYEGRQYACAEDLLSGYKGVLHSDKYGAYEKIANSDEWEITWCPCWAHIRRKFFDAQSGDPKFRDWVLRKIRYLFMFERIAWSRPPDERLKIRLEKEVPIIDELIKEIKNRLTTGKLLPKSNLRQAMGYFCGLIPYLKNYTQHPFARMDNNVAERAIRPLVIGRKNWLFIGSEDHGQAAAIILSLVQSCRALGANPFEYLEDIMRRLMSHNSQKLCELLPDNWLASRQS